MSKPQVVAPRITMRWDVMSGTPCIEGRRIPPISIVGYFMAGDSVRRIARLFNLTVGQVEAAIRYEYGLKLSGKKRPRARKPRGVHA